MDNVMENKELMQKLFEAIELFLSELDDYYYQRYYGGGWISNTTCYSLYKEIKFEVLKKIKEAKRVEEIFEKLDEYEREKEYPESFCDDTDGKAFFFAIRNKIEEVFENIMKKL